ncbi:MAG: NADP-dependent oxidoreductase [Actinomycetota bacterium]|nr:NADP-dependent oxidoreductase [Actinomycetota bacterium]
MSRAVRFEGYGGIDVLEVVEVDEPVPGSGELLVAVKAAGINPGESAIREGLLHDMWPATFPSGQGSDLAGTVTAIGDGVTDFSVGDDVLGFTDSRSSQADHVVVPQTNVVRRPPGVSWEAAGSLHVVGTTAYAAIRAVGVGEGDVLVVSGAAGGVGSVTVQLARREGATVIGLASEPNHRWLTDHGVVPVSYRGDCLADRIGEAAGGSVDAFIDTFGSGYVEVALSLGVAPDRINTIIDFAAAAEHGVKTAGNNDAAHADVLASLAASVSEGALEIPIANAYPLSRVRDAYRELERRHTLGKIVLVP